jgi:NitT/TauT family transport system permease protein
MPATTEVKPWLFRILQAGIALALLGAWQLVTHNNLTAQFFFSRPSRIFMRLWDWVADGVLVTSAVETLKATLIGFIIGVIAGLVLALVCFYTPFVHKLIQPFVNIANAMPRAVFGPLFILWFGLGISSKAALAASLVLFIVFFATLSGLQEVDQNIIHRVRLMGGGPRDLLVHVLLPSAFSWLFASLKTSVGFALAGAVVGEYVGASRGVGYQIAYAEGNLDATGVFAGLLVLSVMVLCLNAVLDRVEHRLTPWRSR